MTCRSCGAELPAPSRRNKRYCDARCRRRAFEQRRRQAELELAPVVPISEQVDVRPLDETQLVSLIVAEAERGTWRAAAWLLERAYPASWAPADARARLRRGPLIIRCHRVATGAIWSPKLKTESLAFAGLSCSSPGWTRTNNPPVNSRMLCQLSYRGTREQRGHDSDAPVAPPLANSPPNGYGGVVLQGTSRLRELRDRVADLE
jgi:hypothetical protein